MAYEPGIDNKQDVIADIDLNDRIFVLRERKRKPGSLEHEDLELVKLEKLREAVMSVIEGDPSYCRPYKLIRDSHFEEYAKKLVTGALFLNIRQLVGMAKHVNWESLSEEMKTNQESVTFDSVMYWIYFPG